jgi:pimeloyl-ACP methyl ester carboxylesterase
MKQFFPLSIAFFLFSCNMAGENPRIKNDIESQGVKISYIDTGKGDTTLFFIHGWCINKTYWDDQIKYFSDRYRVVAVDLPGFGESGKNRKDWSTVAYGKDMAAVMGHLNLQHVILVGHSMAGAIIIESALDAPGRVIGLVGVDNFKGFGEKPDSASKIAEANAILELKHHFRQYATDYFKEALFYKTTDTVVRSRILNDVMHADSAVAVDCIDAGDYDGIAKLAATKKKIHLINSDYTPNDTAGFILHKIPYDLLVIHDTGHFPMVEKPGEFNRLLSETIYRIGKD